MAKTVLPSTHICRTIECALRKTSNGSGLEHLVIKEAFSSEPVTSSYTYVRTHVVGIRNPDVTPNMYYLTSLMYYLSRQFPSILFNTKYEAQLCDISSGDGLVPVDVSPYFFRFLLPPICFPLTVQHFSVLNQTREK